ncbi:MAG: hypothetical protein ACLSH1_06620 [Clostridia bacterium]
MTEKYNITPDSVEFNENSEIILHYYDTVRILLGTDTALEEKMTRVAAILPSLSGFSGELHMELQGRRQQLCLLERCIRGKESRQKNAIILNFL